MHVKCLVYTREFPSDEVLDGVLAPFRENIVLAKRAAGDPDAPPFRWDWWVGGGRYGNGLKLKPERKVFSDSGDEILKPPPELSRRPTEDVYGEAYRALGLELRFEGEKSGSDHIDRFDSFPTFAQEFFWAARVEAIKDPYAAAEDCYCFVDLSGKGFCAEFCDEAGIHDTPGFPEEAEHAMFEALGEGAFVSVIDLHW